MTSGQKAAVAVAIVGSGVLLYAWMTTPPTAPPGESFGLGPFRAGWYVLSYRPGGGPSKEMTYVGTVAKGDVFLRQEAVQRDAYVHKLVYAKSRAHLNAMARVGMPKSEYLTLLRAKNKLASAVRKNRDVLV